MFKHIVMWKLREHAEGADKATNLAIMRAKLETCRAIVPGLRTFEIGRASAGLDATCDIALYSAFDDAAAFQAYVQHPDHQAILPFIRAVIEARHVLDYHA